MLLKLLDFENFFGFWGFVFRFKKSHNRNLKNRTLKAKFVIWFKFFK